jgi:hypothetical protein
MRTKITIHRKPLIMTELQLISSKPLAATNLLVPKLYSWCFEIYWIFQFSNKKRLSNVFISNRMSTEISTSKQSWKISLGKAVNMLVENIQMCLRGETTQGRGLIHLVKDSPAAGFCGHLTTLCAPCMVGNIFILWTTITARTDFYTELFNCQLYPYEKYPSIIVTPTFSNVEDWKMQQIWLWEKNMIYSSTFKVLSLTLIDCHSNWSEIVFCTVWRKW